VKIKTLTLTDFRAFPGPAPQSFTLDGKNLLVYGENGAGKSSLFHALRDFFALKPTKQLKDHQNVFSGQPAAQCRVAVEFTDGTAPVEWSPTNHPGAKAAGDPRVFEAALRRSCLDYRSVLDTNYLHGDNEINLFHIAVKQLVHDFPVTVAGGVTKTIGELWQETLNAQPYSHYVSQTRVIEACTVFNAVFNQALTALHPKFEILLRELLGDDVVASPFRFAGITYQSSHFIRDRIFNGQEVKIDITFRGHQPERPQHFLNEARLSALGLAIYLAGRQAFIPAAATPTLKLLVLDDVLIGLDHSNRLPVLELLKKHFVDWQIVLLTHDRNWYDMARGMLDELTWNCLEIFEGDKAASAPIPIIRPASNRPAKQYLQHARDLLALKYVEAAANYARQALEEALRGGLELKSVKIAYKRNPKDYKLQEHFDALRAWTKEDVAREAKYKPILDKVELLKNVVMNPYSHPSAPNIPENEVQAAIDAVNALVMELNKK
jgi:energy-coupling factor transporter ATP-binding protein EcfA2